MRRLDVRVAMLTFGLQNDVIIAGQRAKKKNGLNATNFNFLFHRSCGKLFCHYCSDHYHPVPSEQLYEPVRVCKVCYDKLGGYHDESVKNGVEH